jgi:hypothetical protein
MSGTGNCTGLNDFVTDEGTVLHPPVAPVFWSFRVMVGTGVAMLLVSWASVWFMWRRRHLHEGRIAGHWLAVEGLPKPILWALVPMAFSGWVATLAGWYTTEIGRQPWLVQGVMTTDDGRGRGARADGDGHARDLSRDLRSAAVRLCRRRRLPRAQGGARDDGRADDMSHSGKAQVAADQPCGVTDMLPDFANPADWLPWAFASLMGLSILIYVILDGFDLGSASSFRWPGRRSRTSMIGSIGPFWDANETWLVLAVGLLLVAFPQAHGAILTALYLPVFVMLMGLILRGVAFEFRAKARDHHKRLWNRAFFAEA